MSQHQPLTTPLVKRLDLKLTQNYGGSLLIMLFPIRSVLFPKRFISCKGQKSYHKAILKGISSSVYNPEEH